MSNEAEYMNLDVENKTSKVETCIVDLFIKVAENLSKLNSKFVILNVKNKKYRVQSKS